MSESDFSGAEYVNAYDIMDFITLFGSLFLNVAIALQSEGLLPLYHGRWQHHADCGQRHGTVLHRPPLPRPPFPSPVCSWHPILRDQRGNQDPAQSKHRCCRCFYTAPGRLHTGWGRNAW